MSNHNNQSSKSSLLSAEEFYSSTKENLKAAQAVLISAQVPEELNLALNSLKNQSKIFEQSPYFEDFHNFVEDLVGTVNSVASHDSTRKTLFETIDAFIVQLNIAIRHEHAKKSVTSFMELLDNPSFKKEFASLLLKYSKQ